MMFAKGGARHRLVGMLAVGLCALLGAAACSSGPKVVNMDASWAESYHSLGELKAHADLGVLGRFSQVLALTHDEKGVQYTDFAFTVDRVLYNRGAAVVPGTVLRIHQTGGVEDGITYQIRDDPLFQVGETVVVFLTQYAPGRYRVIGGPAGRFEVKDGKVSPPNADGVPFTGDVNSLAAEVRDA